MKKKKVINKQAIIFDKLFTFLYCNKKAFKCYIRVTCLLLCSVYLTCT